MKNKAPCYTILLLFVFNFSFAQTNDYPHYANKELLVFNSLRSAKYEDQQALLFPVYLQYKNENILTIIATDELSPWVEANTKGAFDTNRVQLIKILKGILVYNDTLTVYSDDDFNEYKKHQIDTTFYDTLLLSNTKAILEKYFENFYVDQFINKKQNAIIYYLWQHNITTSVVYGPAGEDIEITMYPLFPYYFFTNDFNIRPFGKLW